jgi:hypothetical protein
MNDKTGPHPAGVYWPNGDYLNAEPPAAMHPSGFAVVELSDKVTVHVWTAAQARAIIIAFAKAAALLEPADDDAPPPGCVRCRSAIGPLRRLEHEPGWVCQSGISCDERKAAAAKAAKLEWDGVFR